MGDFTFNSQAAIRAGNNGNVPMGQPFAQPFGADDDYIDLTGATNVEGDVINVEGDLIIVQNGGGGYPAAGGYGGYAGGGYAYPAAGGGYGFPAYGGGGGGGFMMPQPSSHMMGVLNDIYAMMAPVLAGLTEYMAQLQQVIAAQKAGQTSGSGNPGDSGGDHGDAGDHGDHGDHGDAGDHGDHGDHGSQPTYHTSGADNETAIQVLEELRRRTRSDAGGNWSDAELRDAVRDIARELDIDEDEVDGIIDTIRDNHEALSALDGHPGDLNADEIDSIVELLDRGFSLEQIIEEGKHLDEGQSTTLLENNRPLHYEHQEEKDTVVDALEFAISRRNVEDFAGDDGKYSADELNELADELESQGKQEAADKLRYIADHRDEFTMLDGHDGDLNRDELRNILELVDQGFTLSYIAKEGQLLKEAGGNRSTNLAAIGEVGFPGAEGSGRSEHTDEADDADHADEVDDADDVDHGDDVEETEETEETEEPEDSDHADEADDSEAEVADRAMAFLLDHVDDIPSDGSYNDQDLRRAANQARRDGMDAEAEFIEQLADEKDALTYVTDGESGLTGDLKDFELQDLRRLLADGWTLDQLVEAGEQGIALGDVETSAFHTDPERQDLEEQAIQYLIDNVDTYPSDGSYNGDDFDKAIEDAPPELIPVLRQMKEQRGNLTYMDGQSGDLNENELRQLLELVQHGYKLDFLSAAGERNYWDGVGTGWFVGDLGEKLLGYGGHQTEAS